MITKKTNSKSAVLMDWWYFWFGVRKPLVCYAFGRVMVLIQELALVGNSRPFQVLVSVCFLSWYTGREIYQIKKQITR